MATFEQIDQIKQQALQILDNQIVEAARRRNAATAPSEITSLEDLIAKLRQHRGDLFRATVVALEGSQELKDALQGLKATTDEMNEAAERMKATTEFLNNAADLLGAADAAIAALRRAGG